jgi:hypothetical protein
MKDRELVIIGAGAFLTVLCLLFKWPFAIRVVVGMAVLIVFTAFALWPVGPERLTIEEAFYRYLRKSRRPKKYALTDERQAQAVPPRGQVISAPPPEPRATLPYDSAAVPVPVAPSSAASVPASSDFRYEPGQTSVNEVDYYRVVLIWLGVIGIYFIYWLSQGGTQEIGEWMKTLAP